VLHARDAVARPSRGGRPCIVLGCVLGCGPQPAPQTPPPPPADAVIAVDVPLDQDLPQLATRAVLLYEDVLAAFAAAGADCAAAATRLGELATRHADVIAANARVLRDGRNLQLQLALRPHDDRFEAAARGIIESPTLAACAQDPAFADAYDALFGAGT
jgi:hypothetical protein